MIDIQIYERRYVKTFLSGLIYVGHGHEGSDIFVTSGYLLTQGFPEVT